MSNTTLRRVTDSVEQHRTLGRRQRLRIAHLAPTYFAPESVVGGGERYVLYVAQALAQAPLHPQADFSQAILSTGPEDRHFWEENIPVRIFRNDNPHPNMMSAVPGRLWDALREFDIVHVHQSLAIFGLYSSVVARSLHKKLVLTDTGGGNSIIMQTGRGLELADGIISISGFAHSLIASKFSGPHEILLGPVDTNRFSPGPGQDFDRMSAICVSRIMPHKGIDRIIAALPEGMRLRVVGRVYHQSYYELLIQMSRGKDVVFIHDADDHALVRLYRESGIFLQGSTTRDCYGNAVDKPELLGLTALEAMSCGLPVIVSNVGSLPELVPDPRFGRTFVDHQDLVAGMTSYVSGIWPSPDDRERARRHVVLNHSFSVIGRRLADFYVRLFDAPAKGGC
jgi:glycosyltransferase involved in cell wall biosynthesis